MQFWLAVVAVPVMNSKLLLLTVTAMTVMTGCWTGPMMSLNPLYTDKDLSTDLRFQGHWKIAVDGGDICWLTLGLSVKNGDEMKCTSQDGKEERVEVHLVQLSGFQFLDFTPRENDDWHVPVHEFAKVVSITPNELQIQFLGSEWLDTQVAATSFPEHQRVSEDHTVLTGSTRDLQQFILTYVMQPEAFDLEATVLERQP